MAGLQAQNDYRYEHLDKTYTPLRGFDSHFIERALNLSVA